MTRRPRNRRPDLHIECLRTMEWTYDQLLILIGELDLPGRHRAQLIKLSLPLERYLDAASYLPGGSGPLLG